MSPLKVKLGLQIGQKQLIATHLDQSNYLANQQHLLGFVLPLPPLASNALLSRAGMFWLFFIQFEFAGPDMEHLLSSFYLL